MRPIIILSAFMALGATFVAAPVPCAAESKIVVAIPGTPPIFASAIFYVAQQEGFFKKFGVDVELRPFDSGTAGARAIIAGDVQMTMAPSPLIINQISNASADLVGLYGIIHSDMVLASADPAKSSCKDVVGQPVGVDTVGGARSIALRTMLAGGCRGVTINEVTQVPLSSNVGPAMIAGNLTFGVLHLDDVATVEAAGKKVSQILSISDTNPDGHYLLFVVDRRKLSVDRDAYVRVLAGLISAAKFMRDPKNAAEVGKAATVTGHSAAICQATIQPLLKIGYWSVEDDSLDKDRLERLIQLMQKTGGIRPGAPPVAFERLVDKTVWRDAKALVDKAN